MRALYLFLDRTTGVGRPRHTADERLPPIRSGAFAAWLASRPNDGAPEVSGRAARQGAGQGAEQAAGPSNLPAASRP